MADRKSLGFGVVVEGFEDMQNALDRYAKRGADKAIRNALRAGAKIMQAAIERNVPTREVETKTGLPVGALAHDINIGRVKNDPSKQHYYVRVGPGKHTRLVAARVEYGHDAAAGSATLMGQKIRTKSTGKSTPAHPFLRPAWESAQQECGEAIQASLEAAMLKAMEGNGDVDEDSPDAGTEESEEA